MSCSPLEPNGYSGKLFIRKVSDAMHKKLYSVGSRAAGAMWLVEPEGFLLRAGRLFELESCLGGKLFEPEGYS